MDKAFDRGEALMAIALRSEALRRKHGMSVVYTKRTVHSRKNTVTEVAVHRLNIHAQSAGMKLSAAACTMT